MRLVPLLVYGALVWLAAVTAAPLLLASRSSGSVVAGAVVYRAASIVCHQIPERSFRLGGLPLAVCARCFGLYTGAAAASVAMLLVGSVVRPSSSLRAPRASVEGRGFHAFADPASRVWLAMIIAALPTGLSWVVERAGFWAGTNAVRFAAAVPLGLGVAWIVLAAFRAERPDTID